ncbi:MAG: hypothetical protein V4738_09520 [Pseudomonadota bacterium]
MKVEGEKGHARTFLKASTVPSRPVWGGMAGCGHAINVQPFKPREVDRMVDFIDRIVMPCGPVLDGHSRRTKMRLKTRTCLALHWRKSVESGGFRCVNAGSAAFFNGMKNAINQAHDMQSSMA